jgi:hypothetical protein
LHQAGIPAFREKNHRIETDLAGLIAADRLQKEILGIVEGLARLMTRSAPSKVLACASMLSS